MTAQACVLCDELFGREAVPGPLTPQRSLKAAHQGISAAASPRAMKPRCSRSSSSSTHVMHGEGGDDVTPRAQSPSTPAFMTACACPLCPGLGAGDEDEEEADLHKTGFCPSDGKDEPAKPGGGAARMAPSWCEADAALAVLGGMPERVVGMEQRATAGSTQAPADVGVPAPKRFVGPSGDPRFAVWGWCDGHVGDKYRLGEELEKNGDSVWCGAVDLATGARLCCRTVAKGSRHPLIIKLLKNEIDVLLHLQGHPNVVNIMAAFEDKESVHVLHELCERGTLDDRLGQMSEPEVKEALRVALTTVSYCHSKNVLVREVTPACFRFVYNGAERPHALKAATFENALLLVPGEEYPESFFGPAGSSRYWAPELFDGEPSSPSSDVWACGVLLYRLLTAGSFPFTGETDVELYRAVRWGQLDLQDIKGMSQQAKDLLSRLLEQDPSRRISATDALQHAWLAAPAATPAPQQQQQQQQQRARRSHVAAGAAAVVPRPLASGAGKQESEGKQLFPNSPPPEHLGQGQGLGLWEWLCFLLLSPVWVCLCVWAFACVWVMACMWVCALGARPPCPVACQREAERSGQRDWHRGAKAAAGKRRAPSPFLSCAPFSLPVSVPLSSP